MAHRVGDLVLPHPTRVAIDGITAAGKSTFARELTSVVHALGRPVVHVTMDGFHNPRAVRYRQGRMSGDGYYDDAYDFASLISHVLIPLGPNGDGRYRPEVLDLETDRVIEGEPVRTPSNTVLIVDGTFLQRPELQPHWDLCVFLDTEPDVALARGIARDSEALGGEDAARAGYEQRYHAACLRYLESVRPGERAEIVVDNSDFDRPSVKALRLPAPGGSGLEP